MIRHLAPLAFASTSLALLAACGGATVTLRLANETGEAAATKSRADYLAPSYLGMKLVAAYVVEDVDPVTSDNVGNVAMIWLNPECQEDIAGCGPGPGSPRRIQSFFDFARPTETVNAQLNSQRRSVPVGTYRYARLEFCKAGPGSEPNVRWAAASMGAPRGFVDGTCGVTSEPFAEPLVLAAGDAMAVTLRYDLSRSVLARDYADSRSVCEGDPSRSDALCYRDCAQEGASWLCFNPPTFTPGATRDTSGGGAVASAPNAPGQR